MRRGFLAGLMAFLAPETIEEPNQLEGRRLRYLIGVDGQPMGDPETVTEVSYRAPQAIRGISIGYCNLFDEENTGKYGPYRHKSDTAQQYGEGEIDHRGPGWQKNLNEQFRRRSDQGFKYVELDNVDAYPVLAVVGAVELAGTFGLKVVGKNPLIMEGDPAPYLRLCHAAVVERGAGSPADMDRLRRAVGKPHMQVWFVSFGKGKPWAVNTARLIKEAGLKNMFVTYSNIGEYGNAKDIP